MLGKTHFAAGIAVGAAVCLTQQLSPIRGIVCMAGSGLGSLLPDIDHRNSTISKAAKPVGAVVNAVVGHRTIFHDPIFYILAGLLCRFMKPEWMAYIIPILIGVGSHLFLDALNPAGIPICTLLHGPRIHLAKIRTGGKLDTLLRVALTIAAQLVILVWLAKAIFKF